MASAIDLINALPLGEADSSFLACCGIRVFASRLAALRPFPSAEDLLSRARHVWRNEVGAPGWLEAFDAHPRIGLRKIAAEDQRHAQWCEGEQAAAAQTADQTVAQELREWNQAYEDKFGHVFLICAQGRSSPEILAQLKARYGSTPMAEVQVACSEQEKITELRLLKLLDQLVPGSSQSQGDTAAPPPAPTPHISTHVLDTVLGRPGAGISVSLDELAEGGEWVEVGSGVTNVDGRCGDLLKAERRHAVLSQRGLPTQSLTPAYRLRFDTAEYFTRVHSGKTFFPSVSVVFDLKASANPDKVHVPLLLAPFSYSTYRGS